MKLLLNIPNIIVLTILVSCGSENSVRTEKITGAYTVESTFDVPNINSSAGEILGTGKVRDTIYITVKQSGFEVTNKKWRSNSYDMAGWQRLRPGANDGAMYMYHVNYDVTDSSLVSDPPGMMPTLYLNMKDGKLYKGTDRNKPYMKILSAMKNNNSPKDPQSY